MNLLNNLDEVFSILIFKHRLGKLPHFVGRNPSLTVGNAFKTGNFESLTLFKHFNID